MASETDILKVGILGRDCIHCGFHLIPYIAQTLLTNLSSSTYVLITDSNVAAFYLKTFETEFKVVLESRQSTARFLSLVIPPGETSKSREGKAMIEDWLLSNKCTRDTVILALGGGVIGDLVGFVAATLYVLSFLMFRVKFKYFCVQYARRDLRADPNDFACYGRF